MSGSAVTVADGRCDASETVAMETFANGIEPVAVEGELSHVHGGARKHSKITIDSDSNSTADTDSVCAQDKGDFPSFDVDLQRLRTKDPFADEYPPMLGMVARIVIDGEFENNDETMLLSPMARWENSNVTIGSPVLMAPPAQFDATMGSPFLMTPPPLALIAPSHETLAYGSPPSVQPISDVPAATPACALDRLRTYDWLENEGVPSPLCGSVLTPFQTECEELSPSLSSESPLLSSRSQIRSLPVSGVSEDCCPWETKDIAPSFRVPPLCGNGHCTPCYNHIRGKCFNDTCTYCHMPIHAIRRNQKKHQRRAETEVKSKALDAHPEVDGKAAPLKAKCCAGNHHGQLHTATPCQPCFKHIRGLCLLGASCSYCHDKIHADRHRQKKQIRSAERSSTRMMEMNSSQR